MAEFVKAEISAIWNSRNILSEVIFGKKTKQQRLTTLATTVDWCKGIMQKIEIFDGKLILKYTVLKYCAGSVILLWWNILDQKIDFLKLTPTQDSFEKSDKDPR